MTICGSRSRQEILVWKEKQVQVAREEMRVKETLARMTAESGKQPSPVKDLKVLYHLIS